MTTRDHNKHGSCARPRRGHFAGGGTGVGVAGGGAAGAGFDAGAEAGIASRTEPPPPAPLEDISERINDVAMKIPADQAVKRESNVAAPRAPKAV